MTIALVAPVLDVANGVARSPRERSMVCGVQLLGALTVYPPEGAPVSRPAFGTAKNRALLIMLAWHVDRPVACTTILDALWPEAAPDRGRASLRTAASTLRHVIGGHIVREADALVLHDAEVDAIEFQRSAERAGRLFRDGDDVRGLEEADGALRLYRGHLVEDDPLLDPVPGAGDQLRRLWSDLRLDSAQASLRLGRYQDAIALATPVAEDDPCLERACRILMSAYTRTGERAMALRVFDRCRHVLADDFGVDPSPSTERIFASVLRGAEPDLLGCERAARP